MSKQEATRLADAQASAVPLHDELHWMGRLYGFPIMCRGAERIAALEAENAALLALLIRAAPLLEDYAEYANTAPIWHATGGTANAVNPLVAEVNAAIARSKT